MNLCSSGLTTENASFPFCARRWSQQLASYPKRCSSFQNELQILARLHVSLLAWKPFRCHIEGRVRLSLEACGASCTRASCQRHFILTGEKWKSFAAGRRICGWIRLSPKKQKKNTKPNWMVSNSGTSLTLATQWCVVPLSISKAPYSIRAISPFVPVITIHVYSFWVVVLRCVLVIHMRPSYQRFTAVYG